MARRESRWVGAESIRVRAETMDRVHAGATRAITLLAGLSMPWENRTLTRFAVNDRRGARGCLIALLLAGALALAGCGPGYVYSGSVSYGGYAPPYPRGYYYPYGNFGYPYAYPYSGYPFGFNFYYSVPSKRYYRRDWPLFTPRYRGPRYFSPVPGPRFHRR
jgi:hypothetical protein